MKIQPVILKRDAIDGISGEILPQGTKALRIDISKSSKSITIFYGNTSAIAIKIKINEVIDKLCKNTDFKD